MRKISAAEDEDASDVVAKRRRQQPKRLSEACAVQDTVSALTDECDN